MVHRVGLDGKLRYIVFIILTIIIISGVIPIKAYAADMTYYNTGYSSKFLTNNGDEHISMEITDKEFIVSIQTDNSDQAWVRIRDTKATSDEVGSVISGGNILNSKGKIVPEKLFKLPLKNGNIPISNLNKNRQYNIEIYMNKDESNSYRGVIDKSLTMVQYDGKWQFSINRAIYENNLKLTTGTNKITVPTGLHTEIVDLSNEICKGATTDYEKALKLHQWVSSNIYYDMDYFNNITRTTGRNSVSVLDGKRAVCEGYSNLYSDLASAQGLKNVKVIGYALGIGEPKEWSEYRVNSNVSNHAWNEVYVEEQDRWVILDSTWDSGNTYENGNYIENNKRVFNKHFDMTVEMLSLTHKIIDTPRGQGVINEQRDKPSTWAIEGVDKAIELNLVDKALQERYTDTITRAEFTVLAKDLIEEVTGNTLDSLILNYSNSRDAIKFTDTSDKTIQSLYRLGVVNGVGNNKFEPNRSINRQEAAVMLDNITNLFNIHSEHRVSPLKFKDSDKIAGWAKDSVSNVTSLQDLDGKVRVMEGVGNGTFSPLTGYTIEQSIHTILRLYNILK